MSVANSIGGFFVDLGLVTDQESFAKGVTAIGKVELAAKALFGTALKVSGALFGLSAAAGMMANAEEKSSRSIGITVTTLEKWKTACNIAGVSSKELTQNMAMLEEKAQRIKLGQMDEGLAQNLARLRIGPMEFAQADAEQRIKMVFDAAMKDNDPRAMAEVVKDILGGGMKDLFLQLLHSDKSLEDLLLKAEQSSFFTDEHAVKGEEFTGAFNQLKAEVLSLKSVFGSELGEKLTPVIKDLADYLIANKDKIIGAIDGFTRAISDVIEVLFGFDFDRDNSGENGTGRQILSQMLHPIKDLRNRGVSMGISKEMKGVWYNPVTGAWHIKDGTTKIDYNDLSPDLKQQLMDVQKDGGDLQYLWGGLIENLPQKSKVKDGIIAPGGRVTQVAPDDWVFAARDIGKLASAFMPRNFASSANMSVAVNQTITINGNANAMQVKQAAYKGTQNALTEFTNQTSRIVQFMPAN